MRFGGRIEPTPKRFHAHSRLRLWTDSRFRLSLGSSRGGAVAMNLDSGSRPLVLLCPAWKRWGTARTVGPGTVILHSEADVVIPFAESRELVRASGLPDSTLVIVGNDHGLAEPEPLHAMLEACEKVMTIR
jgi:hypothetical protein